MKPVSLILSLYCSLCASVCLGDEQGDEGSPNVAAPVRQFVVPYFDRIKGRANNELAQELQFMQELAQKTRAEGKELRTALEDFEERIDVHSQLINNLAKKIALEDNFDDLAKSSIHELSETWEKEAESFTKLQKALNGIPLKKLKLYAWYGALEGLAVNAEKGGRVYKAVSAIRDAPNKLEEIKAQKNDWLKDLRTQPVPDTLGVVESKMQLISAWQGLQCATATKFSGPEWENKAQAAHRAALAIGSKIDAEIVNLLESEEFLGEQPEEVQKVIETLLKDGKPDGFREHFDFGPLPIEWSDANKRKAGIARRVETLLTDR